MQNTKVLLSITNLKKYFPIKKSPFKAQQLYVRANEDITLNIYEGETLGLVGESGCGKSTLGRTILQLYDQTAGTTFYYGRTRSEIAPRYVSKTLKRAKKYQRHCIRMQQEAEAETQRCRELGEKATFFDLQKMNLASASAQTALSDIAKIMGGLMVCGDLSENAQALLREVRADEALAKRKRALVDLQNRRQSLEALAEEKNIPSRRAAALRRKAAALRAQIETQTERCQFLQQEKETALAAIEALRTRYAGNKDFEFYETMLDDGIDLSRLRYSEMRRLRRDLQIVFQDPYSSLNSRLTIGQSIEEGLVTHKFFSHGSPKMKEAILKVMRACGLQDYMLHRYPHQFSGGQRQRICIARALAVRPKFVVCDECVSALDVSIQSQIINLLEDLKARENLTYLFISHDLSVVRYISDRICVMYLGNIVELASADTIFTDPRHPYTVALLSSIPTTNPDDAEKERIILEGSIPSPIRPPDGCKFHTRCYMACDECRRVPPPLSEVEPGHFVACHKPERKVDENGQYLFLTEQIGKKASRKPVEEGAAP